ncbi:MAG: hypothetical protein FWG83_08135 [Oscillospiraceae bacterium]|nr:hypothetical protein [Oscillospiraceae bacterium]
MKKIERYILGLNSQTRQILLGILYASQFLLALMSVGAFILGFASLGAGEYAFSDKPVSFLVMEKVLTLMLQPYFAGIAAFISLISLVTSVKIKKSWGASSLLVLLGEKTWLRKFVEMTIKIDKAIDKKLKIDEVYQSKFAKVFWETVNTVFLVPIFMLFMSMMWAFPTFFILITTIMFILIVCVKRLTVLDIKKWIHGLAEFAFFHASLLNTFLFGFLFLYLQQFF